jgi:outer membrane receptor protein involved in Fe transport
MAWLMAVLMVLALPLVAAAQTQTGSVTGVVTDATGGVLPGATVTIKSVSGAVKTTVTDSTGRYTIANVEPGSYEVTIELAGFTKQTSKVVVAAGQPVNVEVKLQIAGQAEQIQVTGTLIPRPTLEAMSPVTTLDIQELSYSGKTRLEDLLTSLPQVFTQQNSSVSNGASGTATVNLRNLGSQRTLVLVDGHRLPTGDTGAITADLNFIPSALVKRVDVLTGGASSVYGADAVAGVVNFILDRDFTGIKAGFSYAGFQHNNNDPISQDINKARGFSFPTGSTWDGGQYDANIALGGKFADGKGHASAYLDYRKANALLKDKRDYTNCSVGVLGETGPACGGSSTSPTGRFWTDDGKSWTVQGNSFVPWNSSYAYNYAPVNYMQRPDERWAAGGFVNFDFNKNFKIYLEVMLMDDKTDAQIAPSGDFGNTLTVNCDNPMLSADQYQKICVANGYGPHDIAGLQIYRRNIEGGGRMDRLSHQSFRIAGGVGGELDARKVWSYDVYTLDAETRVPETYLNDFNTNNIQAALTVDGTPGDPSSWTCRAPNTGTAGCVPWNVFQTGGVTQAATNYLALPLVSNGHVKTQLISGKAMADLGKYGWKLPSAVEGIGFVVGAEYRKEALEFQPDLAYQQGWGAGQGSTILPVSGSYNVKDLFVEASLPLAQEVRGAKNLSVGLGYRYSNYNITGYHPSWKVEGTWAPVADLKIRAGFNRAARSPNVVELFQSRSLVLGGSTDPCSNEPGTTPDFTQAQCVLLGVPASAYGTIAPSTAGQYNTFTGGNPNLVPERADTTSVGVVISPAKLTGFNVALDYYDIKLNDTINALNADDILRQCGLSGNSYLCGLIHRDQFYSLWRTPNGYTESTQDNVGKKRAQGLDLNANYVRPMGNSTLTFNFIAGYLFQSFIDTGLFSYDCAGLTGPICNDPYSDHRAMQPKWRHLFRGSWEKGITTVTVGWRMLGGVTAEELSDQADLANPDMEEQLKLNYADKYGAWHYMDVAVGIKLSRQVLLTGGINNIFDKIPPLGSGSGADDYAKGFYGTYDPYGRYLFTNLQFTF